MQARTEWNKKYLKCWKGKKSTNIEYPVKLNLKGELVFQTNKSWGISWPEDHSADVKINSSGKEKWYTSETQIYIKSVTEGIRKDKILFLILIDIKDYCLK